MRRAASNPGIHMRSPDKDIDAYLARLPKDARVALEKLRKTIKTAAPKAVVVISYGMPAILFPPRSSPGSSRPESRRTKNGRKPGNAGDEPPAAALTTRPPGHRI